MEEEHTYELPNLKEAVASCDVNSQYEIPSNCTSGNVNASVTPHQDKSKLKKPVSSWLWMCALVGFILVGSAAFASLALTVWNISQVNHRSSVIVQLQRSLSGLKFSVNSSISEYERRTTLLQNFIVGLDTTVNGSVSEYERRIKQLQNSVNDLNELQANVSRSLEIRIDDILLQLNPAASCSHILQMNPSSPSGHYWIRSSNGSAVRVYCDMTRSCGNITGGWMRVADLDMRDNSSQCPSGLRMGDSCNSEPTCEIGTNSPNGKCSSNSYTSHGLHYTHVCGMIRAYQYRTPDAFSHHGRQRPLEINSNYVDGVSLTYGVPPMRQHIWTFAADHFGKLKYTF